MTIELKEQETTVWVDGAYCRPVPDIIARLMDCWLDYYWSAHTQDEFTPPAIFARQEVLGYDDLPEITPDEWVRMYIEEMYQNAQEEDARDWLHEDVDRLVEAINEQLPDGYILAPGIDPGDYLLWVESEFEEYNG